MKYERKLKDVIFNGFICGSCNSKDVKPYKSGNYIKIFCSKCLRQEKLYRYKLKTYLEIQLAFGKEIEMGQDLLTTKDVAKILNRSPAMVGYFCGRGVIPFYEVLGKIRFRKQDLHYIKFYEKNFVDNRGGAGYGKGKAKREVIDNETIMEK